MANKNIYEIFNDFKEAKNRVDRIAVLRKNDCYALRQILLGTFHPEIKFSVKDIPKFKRETIPAGMSYSHMTDALSRVYLFTEGNPRVPPGLTDKRKLELLLQLLESLEEPEADVFVRMLFKDQKIPYLTSSIVAEAFPGLLPEGTK